VRNFIFLILISSACAHGAVSTSPTGAPANVGQPVGFVNDEPVSQQEAIQAVFTQWRELQNDSEQRKLQLLWVGFEEVAENRLLQAEAKKRGMPLAELLAKEIEARVKSPTDAEVRALYDANRKQIAVSLEQATPQLRAELKEERRESLRRVFVDSLRRSADLRYQIPIPALPRYAVDTGNAPSKGLLRAKVTLIEFADFQCPYCASARSMVEALQKQYPEDVRVVFRHDPLTQHRDAKAAAQAAFCAFEQDKFWPYHDKLFDNPNALSADYFKRFAKEVGMDVAKLETCLNSDRAIEAVAKDVEAAKRFGVSGTPVIFINGMKLIGLLPLPVMQALIEHEIKN
jgi:protein-disulfide isomerase